MSDSSDPNEKLKIAPEKKINGLELLRKPFEERHISKLPKPTKKQTDDLKVNANLGIRCDLCQGWHHKDVVHLDYVGHAALTDRLLEADLNWTWEPLAFAADGLPQFDKTGGLWIKLTVCGLTRYGYGSAESSTFKEVGSREKEVIGDALRNAAMRFGAALDLWHKGDLHGPDEDDQDKKKTTQPKPESKKSETKKGPDPALFKLPKGFGDDSEKPLKEISEANLKKHYNWCLDAREKETDAKKLAAINQIGERIESFLLSVGVSL